MATFDVTGRGAVFLKTIVIFVVLVAGTFAGWLSIERPSREAAAAARRDLTHAEKQLIVSVIRQQLKDVTLTMVTWPQLILLNRAGVTDYCGVINELARTLGFYAQLVFPQNDPREKIGRVAFTVISTPDDPEAKYVVSTACLRYGYGSIAPTTP